MSLTEVLEEAVHKDWGPVLIASFIDGRPDPFAIVYTREGLVKKAALKDLSVPWHYDEKEGKFMLDFPSEGVGT